MRPFVLLLVIVLSTWPVPVARAHSDRHAARPFGQRLQPQHLRQQWLPNLKQIDAFQRRRPGFILDVF